MFTSIAVVQLDSLERALYSIPAINHLQRANPQAKLEIFTLSEATALFQQDFGADSLISIDPLVIEAHSRNHPEQTVEQIFTGATNRKAHSYDLVVNLSTLPLAAVLSSFLSNENFLGSRVSSSKELETRGSWAVYLNANLGNTIVNPFHPVDLYRYIVGAQGEFSDLLVSPTEESLTKTQDLYKDRTGLKIGVLLDQAWPFSEYQRAINEILALYPKSTLTFMASDTSPQVIEEAIKIAESLLQDISTNHETNRVINCAAETNVDSLLALCECQHLIFGPLGLVTTLAAARNTFSIVLAKSDQRLFEAAPYGYGHIILADEMQDQRTLTAPAQVVLEAIRYATSANNGKPPTPEQWQEFGESFAALANSIKILVTNLVSFRQRNGVERTDFLLSSVRDKGSTLQECLVAFYRLIWQFELNESEDVIPDVQVSRADTANGLVNLLDALDKLYRLAEFGRKYTRFVKDAVTRNDLQQANGDATKLQEIDNMIHGLGMQIPAIAPICRYYELSQFQILSNDPDEAAARADIAYERIQVQITIAVDLVNELVSRIDTRIKSQAKAQPILGS